MADRNKLRTRCQGVRESLCIILIKNFFEGQKRKGRKRKITWRDERLVLLVKKKEKKMARRLDGRPRGIRRGKTVSKRRERKISGNACRHGKIVRWHLISPRILLRANEINYVVVPLSRAEEAERQADSKKKKRKRERKIWR